MFEITFAMIKPDITQSKSSGKIITMIEENGFEILTLQQGVLSKELAERFYAMHKDQPFFQELIEFITSGPVITMALAKENAIAQWRNLMGETDPAKAAEKTIRKLHGTNISDNAVHGSDAPETALQELSIFFPSLIQEIQQAQAKAQQ